jgi:riboflavin biosynthesis pyrimidine reductase
MHVWETDPAAAAQSPAAREFAQIWQAADKVVYSTTLEAAATTRTRIERDFEPEAVRRLKAAAERDFTVGGSALGAQAITAGLVDEYHLFVWPVVVGGGKRFLPDRVRLQLELLDERRFGNGVVYLRYRTQTRADGGGAHVAPAVHPPAVGPPTADDVADDPDSQAVPS